MYVRTDVPIRLVCAPEQVTGELRFWITVAASKEVRVEPLADSSLVEPSEGAAGEGDPHSAAPRSRAHRKPEVLRRISGKKA